MARAPLATDSIPLTRVLSLTLVVELEELGRRPVRHIEADEGLCEGNEIGLDVNEEDAVGSIPVACLFSCLLVPLLACPSSMEACSAPGVPELNEALFASALQSVSAQDCVGVTRSHSWDITFLIIIHALGARHYEVI